MEVVGTKSGVTVIDDFGHHPTAIIQTLAALRKRYPGQRIWAAFEPRSNTTRRNVFQKELAQALGQSDGAVISAVARENLLSKEERLDVNKLVEDIRSDFHIPAAHFNEIDQIVKWLTSQAKEGDIICAFSNGKFGGIHHLLLENL